MRTTSVSLMGAFVLALLVLGTGCGKKTVDPPDTNPEGTTTRPVGEDTEGSGGNAGTIDDVIEDPVPTTLNDVFFDYDRFALRSDARRVLDGNAETLLANRSWRVTLEGHCDERGTVEYNLALGDKRARSAKDYLVSLGVSSSQLTTISYGEERPFDTGQNDAAYAKNRRVHFRR